MGAPGDFLVSFLVPLVSGGAVHVGAPLSRRHVRRLAADPLVLGSEAAERARSAREAVAGELVLRPPALPVDGEALALAAAVHDLLFLAHPRSRTVAAEASRRARIADEIGALLQGAPPLEAAPAAGPSRRALLLARHTILHRLYRLEREDVRVSFWAGHAEFRGQRPPARLLAWRSLRRVVEERRVVGFEEGLVAGECRRALGELLRRSPLTDLLAAARSAPPLDLRQVEPALADPALVRMACGRLWREGIERSGGNLWLALRRLAQTADLADARQVRRAVQLCVHLHVLECIAAPGDPPGPAPVFARIGHAGARLDEPLVAFFALFLAARALLGEEGRPPGLADDRALARRVARYEEDVAAFAGSRVGEVVAVLAPALGPGVPASARAEGPVAAVDSACAAGESE